MRASSQLPHQLALVSSEPSFHRWSRWGRGEESQGSLFRLRKRRSCVGRAVHFNGSLLEFFLTNKTKLAQCWKQTTKIILLNVKKMATKGSLKSTGPCVDLLTSRACIGHVSMLAVNPVQDPLSPRSVHMTDGRWRRSGSVPLTALLFTYMPEITTYNTLTSYLLN